MKLKLLDLFCGAGGAAMGYAQAGFDITGVDLIPQPNYPFNFHQNDALEYLQKHHQEFDVIHASPPCQAYSKTKHATKKEHIKIIPTVRKALQKCDTIWIIENVPGAPLINPIELCGTMFKLKLYRHRLFETNVPIKPPPHPKHINPQTKMGRPPKDGEFIHIVGNFSGAEYARLAIGINWMNRAEITQAIPPAYTKFIGEQIINHLQYREKKMPKISCNKVTNAQLGAWVGVVPSTIQSWRKKKDPTPLLEVHQKRIKYLTSVEKLPKIPAKIVELLESAYEMAGHPCAHVTGRDFTDEDRADRYPLKKVRK